MKNPLTVVFAVAVTVVMLQSVSQAQMHFDASQGYHRAPGSFMQPNLHRNLGSFTQPNLVPTPRRIEHLGAYRPRTLPQPFVPQALPPAAGKIRLPEANPAPPSRPKPGTTLRRAVIVRIWDAEG